MSSTELSDIRNTIQLKRAALDSTDQHAASHKITEKLLASDYFKHSQHIAVYMAHNGEINPQAIVKQVWETGKHCYLPVIVDTDQPMKFVRYEQSTQLKPNRFGILEPANHNHTIAAEKLDVVITPLVAFDSQGNRLGSGCGFYDRSFAFLKKTRTKKPLLVGLAYDFQQVDKFIVNTWDVPLHAVVTQQTMQLF